MRFDRFEILILALTLAGVFYAGFAYGEYREMQQQVLSTCPEPGKLPDVDNQH